MRRFGFQGPVSRRSRKVFGPGKPQQKSQTLSLQSCSFHIFLIRTNFPFMQSFMLIHFFFLKFGQLKMASQTRNVFGTLEKRVPGVIAGTVPTCRLVPFCVLMFDVFKTNFNLFSVKYDLHLSSPFLTLSSLVSAANTEETLLLTNFCVTSPWILQSCRSFN